MWKFHCGLGILYDPCPLAPVVGALFRRQNFTDVGSGYTFIGISISKRPPTLVAPTGVLLHW